MKAVVFTTLFPSAERPRHGIFVETRLSHVRRCADIAMQVVAPVPWFPSKSERFGRYAAFARTPREEVRDGACVHHPRYLTLPGAGMYLQPWTLAHGAARVLRRLRRAALDVAVHAEPHPRLAEHGRRLLRRLRRQGYAFDVLDAHYLYPDGVAAAILARKFDVPFVLTARGSDVNVLMRYALPRQLMLWAMREAFAVITVSAALRERLIATGVEPSHVRVLRNGVDTRVFAPVAPVQARAALGVETGGNVFAVVGNLVAEKGCDLVIRALVDIPAAILLIVGEGPERARLDALARALGVADRVRFLAVRTQRDLAQVYSAADALVLASSREGWPNVLLESMACGTPVVATAVGGVPEIVTNPLAGIVVDERSTPALLRAMREIVARPPARAEIVAYAARFGWEQTAREHAALCRDAVLSRASTRADARARLGGETRS